MKRIKVSTQLLASRMIRIQVWTNGVMTEDAVVTPGAASNARNKILDRLTSDPDVIACDADEGIAYPFDYDTTGRGAWGGGVPASAKTKRK